MERPSVNHPASRGLIFPVGLLSNSLEYSSRLVLSEIRVVPQNRIKPSGLLLVNDTLQQLVWIVSVTGFPFLSYHFDEAVPNRRNTVLAYGLS